VAVAVIACVAALALAGAASVRAAGPTALTLSGAGAETLDLTLDDLAKLPQVTVVTGHQFADGEVTYRGPLVRTVIDRLSLGQYAELRFTAANGYYVDIPTSDFVLFDAILAMEADGARLSRRDKGPLWLMYPMSDNVSLSDPIYISRLIWQVVRIEPI
jgi:hypothetical protein